MSSRSHAPICLLASLLLAPLACTTAPQAGDEDSNSESGGDGDGDGPSGDGDGDSGDGDGDGDSGDGDGDSGDGDGDSGDGDGDSGDGDGDGGTDSGDGDSDWSDICDAAPTVGSTECGDGLVGAGEECDDANEDDADACSNTCVSAHAQIPGFAVDARLVEVAPGQTPAQSTLLFASGGAQDMSISARSVDGALLWSAGSQGYEVVEMAPMPGGELSVVGYALPEWDDFRLHLARFDAAGELELAVELPEAYSSPAANNLLRPDGSLVLAGATPDEIYNNDPGVWSFDAGFSEQWGVNPWTSFQTADQPLGVVELDDGTLIAGYMDKRINEGDADEVIGIGFHALDPATGEALWSSVTVCDEAIPLYAGLQTRLSDESIVVIGTRSGGMDVHVFDTSGTLTQRERWPELPQSSRIRELIPDAHGGVYMIGSIDMMVDRDTFVAYWHPDNSQRWVKRLGFGSIGFYDGALEPDERLWVLHDETLVAVEVL